MLKTAYPLKVCFAGDITRFLGYVKMRSQLKVSGKTFEEQGIKDITPDFRSKYGYFCSCHYRTKGLLFFNSFSKFCCF